MPKKGILSAAILNRNCMMLRLLVIQIGEMMGVELGAVEGVMLKESGWRALSEMRRMAIAGWA